MNEFVAVGTNSVQRYTLNISLTTVISHRKNITEKLGIKSVSGLAIYAVMHGYVEADRI
jgi:FixJ family two-component response regulator